MFKNHEHFSAGWWFKKIASVEIKGYNDKDDKLCHKENENQIYNLLKTKFFPFQTYEFLK